MGLCCRRCPREEKRLYFFVFAFVSLLFFSQLQWSVFSHFQFPPWSARWCLAPVPCLCLALLPLHRLPPCPPFFIADASPLFSRLPVAPVRRLALSRGRACLLTHRCHPSNPQVDAIEVTLADFDGVLYHISNPEGDRNKVQISISARFFHELKEIGVEKVRAERGGDGRRRGRQRGCPVAVMCTLGGCFVFFSTSQGDRRRDRQAVCARDSSSTSRPAASYPPLPSPDST